MSGADVSQDPGSDPAGASLPPRPLRSVLTVVTVVWLLLLLLATARQTDRLYPVTSYAMFSHPTGGLNVQFELEGTTTGGRTIELPPEDFGLTQLQMRSFVSSRVGPHADQRQPDAERVAGELARVWSDRHERELVELTVVRVEHSVERADPVRTPVQGWSR